MMIPIARHIPLTEDEKAVAIRLDKAGVPRAEIAEILTTTLHRVDSAIGSERARIAAAAERRERLIAAARIPDEQRRLRLHTPPPTEPTLADLLRVPIPMPDGTERHRQAAEIYNRLGISGNRKSR
jgi:hypothetical protein